MSGGAAAFPDHFSPIAAEYATFRPTYPEPLFDWVAEVAPARNVVWDCACGSGQATAGLADRFDLVVATDGSPEQLAWAPPVPRTIWSLATAEASGLPDASVDAVVIAQALHWFDLPRFWAEVRRVVRPGGLVTAWSYGPLRLVNPAIDALISDFYLNEVGPWWPPSRRHVDAGYATLDFPFHRLSVPPFAMHVDWTLEQLLGYLRSWSATQRYLTARGRDPVSTLAERLELLWGSRRIEVRWPLAVLAGYTAGR